jgi:hypothetical protein
LRAAKIVPAGEMWGEDKGKLTRGEIGDIEDDLAQRQ